MKAFEEWRDRQENEGVEQGFRYGNKQGWRAALEWAISKGVQNEESSQMEIEIMAWDLEEELEDE